MMRCVLFGLCLLVCLNESKAQETSSEASDQLWLNFILGRPVSEKFYVEYDFEAATQVSGGGDPWRYLYGTGLFEHYPNGFVDLTGELVTGFTKQDSQEDSFEATVRLGLRLHLIDQIFNSSLVKEYRPERMSGKRLGISNLARLEYRNFWYNGDRPFENELRFRNRIEFKLALNRPTLASDRLWYLITDAEWFIPLSDKDEVSERFATKRRIRLGLGFRQSYEFRYELIVMRDKARDTLEGDVEVDANIIDFRFKWFF
jgi:hypothetical protein